VKRKRTAHKLSAFAVTVATAAELTCNITHGLTWRVSALLPLSQSDLLLPEQPWRDDLIGRRVPPLALGRENDEVAVVVNMH
jgi:hypothetical protein